MLTVLYRLGVMDCRCCNRALEVEMRFRGSLSSAGVGLGPLACCMWTSALSAVKS